MVDYLMDKEFQICIEFVLHWEGGYVNNAKDPGGETKYGISKRYHPNLDIKNLTVDDAKHVYYKEYWLPSRANQVLDLMLKRAHFDTAVNCGVTKALGWLTDLKGNPFRDRNPDLFMAYIAKRKQFYMRLAQSIPSESVFLQGWLRRVSALEVPIKEPA